MGNSKSAHALLPPLQTVARCETKKMMGTWFVVGVKPTPIETRCSNAVETYTFVGGTTEDETKHASKCATKPTHDIDIDFQMNDGEPLRSKLKSYPQKGYVVPTTTSTSTSTGTGTTLASTKEYASEWKVSPLWPVKLSYLILEVDDLNYMDCVIGYPNRQYVWILSRTPLMETDRYAELCRRLTETHRYDLTNLRKVPQVWTAEERDRRGLREIIPDRMLTTPSA